jgi:seryl-tRNA synthetase
MNDPKILRGDTASVQKSLSSRNERFLPVLEKYLKLDEEHRALLQDVEVMRAKRNESSKAIGKAMAAKEKDEAERLKKEVSELKAQMTDKESALSPMKAEVRDLLLSIPNLPHSSVPVGKSEDDNTAVRDSGAPKKPAFAAKDHAAIGEALGILDFDTAAKMAGARFAVVSGQGARLQRALGQFMIDLHTREHGYQEMYVPLIVRPEALEGTGQLPKFEEDLYKTGQLEETEKGAGDADPTFLIPTAEVPLTNLVREEILDGASLPRQVTALTPCFRQEAGSYGKDTRGLIRQHQFEKTELVWITKPEASMEALELLTTHAEEVLKRLGLPYRVIELCTADIGFGACKTYDLEVWMAGEGKYREISSCSNCWDFQARRMNTRFRREAQGAPEFVHTLNGSGLAVGRAFAAILENYQNADGSVTVPEVLRSYTGFDKLTP